MPELSTVDLKGKRVFLRCDLNVPIKDGVIKDDGRIKASLPTIQLLLSKGASVLIAAHLGRPKNGPAAEFSLAPVAKRLGELLKQEVKFSEEITGNAVAEMVSSLKSAEILLLENIRFSSFETSKDDVERETLQKSWHRLQIFTLEMASGRYTESMHPSLIFLSYFHMLLVLSLTPKLRF